MSARHQLLMNPNIFANRQGGIALVTCLIFLGLLTLLALPMFVDFDLQHKIAANTREKESADHAAESGLQYGEWWLMKHFTETPVICGPQAGSTQPINRICTNFLNAVEEKDPSKWNGATYRPPTMLVAGSDAPGGVGDSANTNSSGAFLKDIKYTNIPGLYTAYLGLSGANGKAYYSVTAVGYGGNKNTTSVVQSVYEANTSTNTNPNSSTNLNVIDRGQP